MPHNNRKQISVPRRLVDELCIAVDSGCKQMENILRQEDDLQAMRAALEFGRRTLAETRRRLSKIEVKQS